MLPRRRNRGETQGQRMTATPLPKKKAKKKRVNYSKECDRLFSLIVRSVGHCESGRTEHAGNLQCAHGFSRRYHATRWDRRNAWAMCAGCHFYFTVHPLEFDNWLYERWGTVQYLRMRNLALRGPLPDLAVLLIELKAAA